MRHPTVPRMTYVAPGPTELQVEGDRSGNNLQDRGGLNRPYHDMVCKAVVSKKMKIFQWLELRNRLEDDFFFGLHWKTVYI